MITMRFEQKRNRHEQKQEGLHAGGVPAEISFVDEIKCHMHTHGVCYALYALWYII